MGALDDRVSMAEIARLAEVRAPAVSNWRRRHHDFPQPDRRGGQDVFLAADVAAWLDRRRIVRSDLKAGEPAGTTYGQRFRRNLGLPDAVSEVARGLSEVLWEELDRHRGHAAASEYGGLTLRLLYLRACDRARWADLVRAATGPRPHHELGVWFEHALAAHKLRPPQLHPRPNSATTRTRAEHLLVATVSALDRIDARSTLERGHLALAFSDLLARMADSSERQGGEYHTPDSVVRTVAALTAPTPEDWIHDPCCGSGDLLVGAARHALRDGAAPSDLLVSGQALGDETWELARMHLAVHGIAAELGPHPALTLTRNLHADSRFDVVITNPPFNLRAWSDGDPTPDPRWRYGLPPEHNANFAWLQHAVSSLAEGGRAAVLMANGASSSANAQEHTIRAAMVEDGAVEGIIALPPQLFQTTAIPVSLWLLRHPTGATDDDLLFVDATALGTMVDRNRRELTDDDVDRIAGAYNEWRRHKPGSYRGIAEFSASIPVQEVRERNYNLNPRGYLTMPAAQADASSTAETLRGIRQELDRLHARSATVDTLVERQLRRVDVWNR